ncbi:MAG TPA: hypothetical protein VFE87_01395 [Candidatus Paceibacterota bacterium]|nr:hypothetical protein [Candidatus Paceibacterota bacterium]
MLPALIFMSNCKKYVNELERRAAALFEREGIPFDYGVDYLVRNGRRTREVDFVLHYPVRAKMCLRESLQYIEIKQGMNAHAKIQHDDLLTAGIDTFIATAQTIEMWEKVGFLAERLERVPMRNPIPALAFQKA